MDFEKQKEIYELIEKDLRHLENKESPLIEYITHQQIYFTINEYCNKLRYQENIEYYKKFISLITTIVKQIGLPNNSISYSQVVENLIMCGYLSLGNPVHPYKELRNSPPLDLTGLLGFDVLPRRGCCRHISEIHKNIFDNLNLYCENYMCYDFLENEEFQPILEPRFDYILTTHEANLIIYHGQYYIHDSFNKAYFYLVDGFTAKEYNNFDDKIILCYTPVGNIIFNQIPYNQVLQYIEKFQESSQHPHIDISELNDILLETNDRFYNSTKLLLDFRHEAEPYIKRIVKNLYN